MQAAVEGAHGLIRDKVGVGHAIRGEMDQVTPGAGFFPVTFGAGQDLFSHIPGMTVAQVMSIFLPDGDIGA